MLSEETTSYEHLDRMMEDKRIEDNNDYDKYDDKGWAMALCIVVFTAFMLFIIKLCSL